MKLNRKVTDFIKLEEGSIGHKSAVVTGALLASSLLGTVLVSPAEAALCHCDDTYSDHYNYYDQCPTPC